MLVLLLTYKALNSIANLGMSLIMMIKLKNVPTSSLVMFSTLIFNIPVHMVVTQVVSVVDNVDTTVLYIDNELVLVPEINKIYYIFNLMFHII